jgi:replicative DNA helicase
MTKTQVDYLPPNCIEAEEAVLGGIFLDPNAIQRIAETLKPEAFYLESHQEIYKAAIALYRENKPTNLLFVATWLSDADKLAFIGGRNKLASLVDRTVSTVNVDALAALIIDKHQRRQLIKAGNEVSKLGEQEYIPLEDITEEIKKKIAIATSSIQSEEVKCYAAPEMAVSLFDYLENGTAQGLKVGWYDLEAITGGIKAPMLCGVAAESSMGKSHFMLSYAHEIMTVLGLPVLYFSPEMSKEQLNIRMIAKITGIDSNELVYNTALYWDAIAKGIEYLGQLPWHVVDCGELTSDIVRVNVEKVMQQYGHIGAVFVDYLQQMPVGGSKNLSHEYGLLTKRLFNICKDFKIPMFLGSQINRENQNRQDKRPTRHDLRNSGEIFETLDQLIMLFRPNVYSKDTSDRTIELIVEKNRNGKTGTATMLCDLSTSRFLNMAR